MRLHTVSNELLALGFALLCFDDWADDGAKIVTSRVRWEIGPR